MNSIPRNKLKHAVPGKEFENLCKFVNEAIGELFKNPGSLGTEIIATIQTHLKVQKCGKCAQKILNLAANKN